MQQRGAFLNPMSAGLFMGLAVALSLFWTQSGLHVSGLFSLFCDSESGAPQGTAINELLCSPNSSVDAKSWLPWMVGGIFLGGLISSFIREHGLKFEITRGLRLSASQRLLLASLGGLIVGIGSAIAGGCTSSIGLTGSALFSVGSFAFLGLFFIGGFFARIFFGRYWYD